MPHTFLALLLLANVEDASTSTFPARVQILDLGRLTFRNAQQFTGQPVRVSFVVDSLKGIIGGVILVDAAGSPGASRSVRFVRWVAPRRLATGDCVEVEGILRTRIIPARVIGFERFEAVYSVEVVEARSVTRP